MTVSDTSAFEEKVASKGYTVVRKTLEPSEGSGDHAHDYHVHDYDVWGLVIEGEFRITVDGETKSYREGEEFELAAGCDHTESTGPQGATFVVGRRQR
jgi:quercetin dioxygenase-like cupin family protein